jgi:hypothetical protein
VAARAALGDERGERAWSALDGSTKLDRSLRRRGGVGQRKVLGTRRPCRRDEPCNIRTGSKRDDLKLRVRGRNLQRLRANRTGRSKDGQTFHLSTWCQSFRPAGHRLA